MKTLIIIVAVALVLTVFFIYLGISAHNDDAKEKGTTEKGYSFWSVLTGAVFTFFMLLYEIVKEVFFPSRYRTKK
jgi:hypothetical protein